MFCDDFKVVERLKGLGLSPGEITDSKTCLQSCKGTQKCGQYFSFYNYRNQGSSGWDTPGLSNPSPAGQGLARFPSSARCFFHQTSCASLTPPPKVLRKFPPSANPGRVGPFCGMEQTGKTAYSNSEHTTAALAGGGGVERGRALRQVLYPEVLWTDLRLPAQRGHLTFSWAILPYEVVAWGSPTWRVP
jgi:hypothetical protein